MKYAKEKNEKAYGLVEFVLQYVVSFQNGWNMEH